MISTGILWVKSFTGGALALTANLPLGLIAAFSPIQLPANLVKPQAQFLTIAQQHKNAWQKTLISKTAFTVNWINRQLSSYRNKSIAVPSITLKAKETQFCPSVPENIAAQPHLKNATNFLPIVTQVSVSRVDLSPSTVVRSLQSFFNVIRNPVDPNGSYDYSPVLIVKRNPSSYEVWVNNSFVARLPDRITAKALQNRLQQLTKIPAVQPTELQPGLVDKTPSMMVGNRLLFAIDQKLSQQIGRSGDILAMEWTNNLRIALHAKPLTLVQGQMEMYGLQSSTTQLSGIASWYGGYFHGRLTANGEIYDQDDFTVAHRTLPFNTFLKVTNLENNKSVIVRVNDRGPYILPRSLDLSRTAARCLDSEHTGVVAYKAVVLQQNAPQMTLKPSQPKTENMANAKSELLVSNF
ncbi:MAG: septal ring lytic transglycosylase RlpA family protein [Aphanizomenon gracile PMC649.10]|jgi:rare lipoprotein A|nr:septal ring lytic transglycosylase RlpA family protein [Aphanizomenon gracile PMC638.10]MDM3849300.1 septal ring lytic transglycosylase RlpA family protein [Aphanizomenon gracile PMC627.10]MDM3858008.1 septal ring lytic transglycosylase RlpA family protein [Aphanizomenon gracile PMC649.10]